MLNAASQPTASTLQPFRLLDLPRELLITVFRSYRSPITEYGKGDGLFIYAGEKSSERYGILRGLCLTHRDILSFAQEELFKRLDIRSVERMDLLVRSIASSQRCKEYAGRAESIYLGPDVNSDKLMESGAFNPRELKIRGSMKFSLLNRFPNLRQVHVYNPTYDEALVLPNLEAYSVSSNDLSNAYNASGDFESVNLPNLRRLSTYDNRRPEAHGGTVIASFGNLYDSVIPQLDHLHLFSPSFTDLEHLLLISTSLQSLHVIHDDYGSESSELLNLLSLVNSKALYYALRLRRRNLDAWERDFESVKKIKAVLEGNDVIKRVQLRHYFRYLVAPSPGICARSLARWKELKDELISICAKRGIKISNLQCYVADFSAETSWIDGA